MEFESSYFRILIKLFLSYISIRILGSCLLLLEMRNYLLLDARYPQIWRYLKFDVINPQKERKNKGE